MRILHNNSPQIKICGLTDISEAKECAVLGADAIGFVFFPKSPRNITVDQAKKISMALPENIKKVGVFVNPSLSFVMERVKNCCLDLVQLHGQETCEFINALKKEKINVIKTLFTDSIPSLDDADKYRVQSYLVECGKGKLPGGNARDWDFKLSKKFGKKYPLVLAGGLSPQNIEKAIADSCPDAVDVSSGVEYKPGRKDISKVRKFIKTVITCSINKKKDKIF
jgi:phosphoribosylanthranilate isomerase